MSKLHMHHTTNERTPAHTTHRLPPRAARSYATSCHTTNERERCLPSFLPSFLARTCT